MIHQLGISCNIRRNLFCQMLKSSYARLKFSNFQTQERMDHQTKSTMFQCLVYSTWKSIHAESIMKILSLIFRSFKFDIGDDRQTAQMAVALKISPAKKLMVYVLVAPDHFVYQSSGYQHPDQYLFLLNRLKSVCPHLVWYRKHDLSSYLWLTLFWINFLSSFQIQTIGRPKILELSWKASSNSSP